MKKVLLIVILLTLLLLAAAFYFWQKYKGIYFANAPAKQNVIEMIEEATKSLKPGENQTELPLKIPDGYALSIYAKDLGSSRDLTLDPNGVLLTSIISPGRVVAIKDSSTTTVIDKLDKPHGLAFSGNRLYVAETDRVVVYDYDPKTLTASNGKKIIDLPDGGMHFSRSLLIKGNTLYVAIGSDCNACVETDTRRAAIWKSNLDGSDFRPYATGLRNSVFLTVRPGTEEIWATNMGRDFLGENLPPETVNVIEDGANYGWPYCYGNQIADEETNASGKKYDCSQMETPRLSFQAHSAPLGLAFLGNDLLVAYHGSWNRNTPTGYKVVRFYLDSKGSLVSGPEDFVSGWLKTDGQVLGRPVDVLVKDESIYISDDKAGVIYLLKPL